MTTYKAVETVAHELVRLDLYAPGDFPTEHSQAADLIETYQLNAEERTDAPISEPLLAELLEDLHIEAAYKRVQQS